MIVWLFMILCIILCIIIVKDQFSQMLYNNQGVKSYHTVRGIFKSVHKLEKDVEHFQRTFCKIWERLAALEY